jgi:hypothetical protein
LRDNEVDTFPALLRRVLEDVRRDQQLFSSSSANGADGKDKDKDKPNGDKKGAVNGAGAGGGEKPALAIPNAVVEEALKATMESLKEIVTLED